jgi:tetratricopeptide (TPR) repeat protein
MQVQTKNAFASSVRRNILLTVAMAICCFGVNLRAQEPATDAKTKSFDQTKAVRAIYDATKTAKTANDFTEFLKKCDDALASELSTENRNYVASLSGWGLNRRGEKNFEMAVQLKRIGNTQHESAMKQAMEDFDAAVIAAPERYRSWMSRGIAHVANENYEKAILDFTEVTKLKTDEPNGWFNRAEAFYHRGNYGPAIRDYDIALRLNSSDAQALTGRGLSAYALGKFEDALTDFNRVIELHRENDAAYLNRGDAHQELGKWQLANDDYQRAIEIKETSVACQRLAWLKATCPDPAFRDSILAKKMVDRAIALAGDTPANLDTLAAAEAADGNFDAAKTTQQKVIALVNAEEDLQAGQYQARLMLYEKSEPFVQQINDDSEGKHLDDEDEPGKD